jgi:SH3-like domain-containing protein
MIKKNIFTLLFICSFVIFSNCYAFSKMVSVAGENVNLRSGPGENYSVRWKYGSGFPLKELKQKGSWVMVEDFEGDSGWLHKSLVSRTGHMIVKVNKKSNKKINIRSGPGTNYKVVGKAYYGVVFRTVKQQQGWAKVRHERGLEGWIKRSLLWGF